MGCYHSLDDQNNNVVFKSAKVQQMVADGAKTAFDIWYECDKGIYVDDEVFAQMLYYAKEHDTQKKTFFKRRFSYVDRMQTDFQGKPNSVCC